MKKIDGLDELNRWVLNTDDSLRNGFQILFQKNDVANVQNLIMRVSIDIKNLHMFYADELLRISPILFFQIGIGVYQLNTATFGELYLMIRHLVYEPLDSIIWVNVHPRIIRTAKELYEDGHYSPAANRSFVEVETRLREVFLKLKPGTPIPSKVGDLIGALLSERGAYQFCDTSTQSGRDYQRGVQRLFEGAFAAFRNPSSHQNTSITAATSFDQIILASQLMKVLDNA